MTTSVTAPRAGLLGALRHHMDLLGNAGSLMASTVLTSGLGFVYWWLAARAAPAEAVGQVSAAVSAMTLIGTIGMFGMGTMLIAELPKMATDRWNMISTCLLVTGSAATVGGIGYIVVAHLFLPNLRTALGSPVVTALLLFGIVVNAITLVLDEALVGLLAGPLQLLRNAYFSVGKLVLLGGLALLPVTLNGGELLLTWVAGSVGSVAVLAYVLKRRRMVTSLRPRLELLRGMGRATFDHNLLNMALFVPRMAMPIVVTAVLSTTATAGFYTAWMVLSFVCMIPANVALTLFAVASGDRGALRSKVRMGLLVSLGLGVPIAVVMGVAAGPIMSVFGAEYARIAGTALAVLSLGYVPIVIQHFYLAISRVNGRIRQAGLFAVVAGAAEIVAAVLGGSDGSLNHLVIWLVAVFAAQAVWMAPTVVRGAFARTSN
jgi:O-antigen/teichoic acid export membrane protein